MRNSSPGAMIAALSTLTALGACASLGGISEGRGDGLRGEGSPHAAASSTASGSSSSAPSSNAATQRVAQRSRGDIRREREQIGRADILTQMTFWAGEYQAHGDELEVARRFVTALRSGGRYQRAAEVAAEALRVHATDTPLLYAQGASLLAMGRAQDALAPLATVARAEPQNWRARSALGAALDQVGRSADARAAYQEALMIQPNEPSVMTNLGVSHLMAGDPVQAETILRQASELPNAPAAARQNLALAVGLQGRFDEAEQLERIDLPPNVVAENMAYIRSLLDDGRRWSDVNGASAAPSRRTPRVARSASPPGAASQPADAPSTSTR